LKLNLPRERMEDRRTLLTSLDQMKRELDQAGDGRRRIPAAGVRP